MSVSKPDDDDDNDDDDDYFLKASFGQLSTLFCIRCQLAVYKYKLLILLSYPQMKIPRT